jgi:hypothetical protein
MEEASLEVVRERRGSVRGRRGSVLGGAPQRKDSPANGRRASLAGGRRCSLAPRLNRRMSVSPSSGKQTPNVLVSSAPEAGGGKKPRRASILSEVDSDNGSAKTSAVSLLRGAAASIVRLQRRGSILGRSKLSHGTESSPGVDYKLLGPAFGRQDGKVRGVAAGATGGPIFRKRPTEDPTLKRFVRSVDMALPFCGAIPRVQIDSVLYRSVAARGTLRFNLEPEVLEPCRAPGKAVSAVPNKSVATGLLAASVNIRTGEPVRRAVEALWADDDDDDKYAEGLRESLATMDLPPSELREVRRELLVVELQNQLRAKDDMIRRVKTRLAWVEGEVNRTMGATSPFRDPRVGPQLGTMQKIAGARPKTAIRPNTGTHGRPATGGGKRALNPACPRPKSRGDSHPTSRGEPRLRSASVPPGSQSTMDGDGGDLFVTARSPGPSPVHPKTVVQTSMRKGGGDLARYRALSDMPVEERMRKAEQRRLKALRVATDILHVKHVGGGTLPDVWQHSAGPGLREEGGKLPSLASTAPAALPQCYRRDAPPNSPLRPY